MYFISEITKCIVIKSGIVGMQENLSVNFNFGACLFNMIRRNTRISSRSEVRYDEYLIQFMKNESIALLSVISTVQFYNNV